MSITPGLGCGRSSVLIINIVIDVPNRRLDVDIPEEELLSRLREWVQPEPRYKQGVLGKYAALVQQASEGATTLL